MIPPIFVIGCPRSGTSLLARLLEPTIYGSPVETHFITKYYKKYRKYGDLKEKSNFIRLTKAILRERPILQWRLNIDIEELWRKQKSYEYKELVGKLCSMRFKELGKQSWGDKTPQYILELDIIYTLFSDSKYLYVVRDGRDVALSLLKKPWGQNNIYSCAEYWKRCNEETEAIDSIRGKGNLLEINYEALLKKPMEVMKGVYSFLGESFPEKERNKILDAIRQKNYNKWKNEMKPRDIKMFETVAGNTLERLGYETSYVEAELKKPFKWFWKGHDYLLNCKHLAKLNLIDTIRIKYFGMEPFAD